MTKETAMKILKELHGKSLFAERTALETLIPELKESEDEKIRKALVRFHKSTIDIDGIKGTDILAWLEKQGESYTKNDVDDAYLKGISEAKNELEKQGEQKPTVVDFNAKDWYVSKVDGKIHDMTYNPTDRAEPKFKVGDWVVDNRTGVIHYIANIKGTVNGCYYVFGNDKGLLHIDNEEDYHLWTIQDAKDGDALVAPPVNGSEQIFIFKEIKDRKYVKNAVEYYCRVFNNEFCVNERGFMGQSDDYFTPATKEQRELLFKKMEEAGYEWDAEKKELKNIEDEIEIPFGAKDSELQEETYFIPDGFHAEIDGDKVVIKKGEKPAEWSDEDENYLQSAENACEYQYGKNTSTILWLKSLKYRATWKPSKEQMEALDDALNEQGFDYNYLNSLYEQLKKL